MNIFKHPAFYITIFGFGLLWHNIHNKRIYSPRNPDRIKASCAAKMLQVKENIELYQKKYGAAAGEFDLKKISKDHNESDFSCPYSFSGNPYYYKAKRGAVYNNENLEISIEVSCENHGELSKQHGEHSETGIEGPKLKGINIFLKLLYGLNAAGIMIFSGFVRLVIDLRGFFSIHSCPVCDLTFYDLNGFETHFKQCRITLPPPDMKEKEICLIKKICAFLIDTSIIILLLSVFVILMKEPVYEEYSFFDKFIFSTLPLPVFIFYLFKDIYNCQSPGKMLVGLDVTDLNGARASYGKLMLRNLPLASTVAIFFICFLESRHMVNVDKPLFIGSVFALIDLISMFGGKSGRRAGDYMAGTRTNDLNVNTAGGPYLFIIITLLVMFSGLVGYMTPGY